MAFVVQSHVRLHEWAAEERGFFRREGPNYEFEVEGFADGAAARESRLPATYRCRFGATRSRTWREEKLEWVVRLPLGGQRDHPPVPAAATCVTHARVPRSAAIFGAPLQNAVFGLLH